MRSYWKAGIHGISYLCRQIVHFSPLCMLELNACRCMIRCTGLKLHLGYLDPHTSNPSNNFCTDSILYINFAMFVFLTAMSRQQSLRTRSVRTGRSRRRRVRWSQWQFALSMTMSDKKTMNYHSKPVRNSRKLKLRSRILSEVVWNSSELKLSILMDIISFSAKWMSEIIIQCSGKIKYQGVNDHIGGSSNSPRVKLAWVESTLINIKLSFAYCMVKIPKILGKKQALNQKVALWATN